MRINYYGREIDLNDFLAIYEPYQNEMTKREFSKILGIYSQNCYDRLMYFGDKIRIFEPTYEEIKQNIINEVKKRNYHKGLITKGEFEELYELYMNFISKNQLANILGINIKKGKTRYKINYKKQCIERVKYLLSFEARMYSKDELEKICRENGITLYDLLESIYKPYSNEKKYKIIEKLLGKKGIFMGKTMIPKEFQERYSKIILDNANLRSKRYAIRFRQFSNYEDIASDALMYVLYNKGDLVINSDNDEEAINSISAYLSVYIKYKYILMTSINRNLSLDEDIKGQDRKRYEVIKSEPIYVARDEVDRDESIISEMQRLYDYGLSNTETINFIIQKYGFKEEEVLDILKSELSKRRTIKEDRNGNFYLGE